MPLVCHDLEGLTCRAPAIPAAYPERKPPCPAFQLPATIDAAPAASQPLLEAVKKQLGVVPNLFRLVSNSPAALEGYLGLSGALEQGQRCRPRRASASRWPSPRSTAATIACRPTPISARTSPSSTTPRSTANRKRRLERSKGGRCRALRRQGRARTRSRRAKTTSAPSSSPATTTRR